MNRVVADCSILVKFFVPEIASEASIKWLEKWQEEKAEIWIPELALIEFVNVMWLKVTRKEFSTHAARENISDFLNLPFHIARHMGLAEASFRLAINLHISAYDACYVALAHYLRTTFFTADKKLAHKLKESPILVKLVQ